MILRQLVAYFDVSSIFVGARDVEICSNLSAHISDMQFFQVFSSSSLSFHVLTLGNAFSRQETPFPFLPVEINTLLRFASSFVTTMSCNLSCLCYYLCSFFSDKTGPFPSLQIRCILTRWTQRNRFQHSVSCLQPRNDRKPPGEWHSHEFLLYNFWMRRPIFLQQGSLDRA